MLQVVAIAALVALMPLLVLADVDDVEDIEAVAYPTTYRSRALYLKAGCTGTPYEIIEEPFDTCLTYVPENKTTEESLQFKNYNAAANKYQICIYTDKLCKTDELCQDIATQCAQANLGGGIMAYTTHVIGPRKTLGKPAMFALWKYNLYGGSKCDSVMTLEDESFELSIGQCIKSTDFNEWTDQEARFCAYKDAKCQDPFPYQCSVVRLDGCYITALNQSYNSSVTYNKATKAPSAADQTTLSALAVLVAIGTAWAVQM